jgi:hypothetical protein
MDTNSLGEVHEALCRARAAVDDHWDARWQQGHESEEDEQTAILLRTGHPTVRYAQFNRPEEAEVGADWLWWFVDKLGECFGMLVQAKRLRKRPAGWSINFDYRGGSQLRSLLASAEHFGVPAAYMLYCGDSLFREGLPCGSMHLSAACPRCRRMGVSVLAGPCASYLISDGQGVEQAIKWSLPLEDMVVPRASDSPISDVNLRMASAELRAFLVGEPQTPARQVAKRFFEQVVMMRKGHFTHAVTEQAPARTGRVFGATPADPGHFNFPYYDHVLRGLRFQLPHAVRAVVLDNQVEPVGFESLAGIVIVSL